MKRKKKGHEMVETKDETENEAPEDEVEGGGRACRQKGWWNRGDVEAKLNTVNMTHGCIRNVTASKRRLSLNFKKHGTAQNRRMNVPCD